MVVTSDYYTLYHHYKELSEWYGVLTAQHQAYGYIAYNLAEHLQETPQEQRNYVGILLRALEVAFPVSSRVRAIYREEVKTLKTFLEKTKGEYSE